MLKEFNDGKSKNLYCVAATIIEIEELKTVLQEAQERTRNLELKEKNQVLYKLLDYIATRDNLKLKLRK